MNLRQHLKDFLEERTRRGAVRAVDQRLATEAWRQRHGSLADGAVLAAWWQSADYIARRMYRATPLPDREAVLATAAAAVRGEGLWCEFGVAEGGSLRRLCTLADGRTVHGFDSFAGLPADWRHGFPAGTFACAMPNDLPANACLETGFFNESLPPFLAAHPEPFALVHIDCDLRKSTSDILSTAATRFRFGTVIVFDEYFNHPGWRDGEFAAFQAWRRTNRWNYEYLAYAERGEQVAVRLLGQDGR